jgi:hypothetical protein
MLTTSVFRRPHCSVLVWSAVSERGAMGCAAVHSRQPVLPRCASSSCLMADELVQHAHLCLLARWQVRAAPPSSPTLHCLHCSHSHLHGRQEGSWQTIATAPPHHSIHGHHRHCRGKSAGSWSIYICSMACRHTCDPIMCTFSLVTHSCQLCAADHPLRMGRLPLW